MAGRRWEPLYNALYERIRTGSLPIDSALPTEQELEESWGLTRYSVREALRQLEARGIITRAKGPHGRRVRGYNPRLWDLTSFEVGERRDDPDVGDDWAAGIRDQGETPTESVDVNPSLPPAHIAEYLQVTTDTWLMCRRRWRYADDELISIADTWILDEIAKLPAVTPDGDTVYPFMTRHSYALPGGFIRAVGITQTWVEDRHFARRPSIDEASMLDVPTDEPVSEVSRIGYQGEPGTLSPFRVLHTISPGRSLAPRYWLKVHNEKENPS